jgi:peptidoglycan hydrolase-like protein with peptidoglycan-binding domain
VPINGVFGTSTAQGLAGLQSARGLPPTGETDPATWQALLALPFVPVDWTARGQ